MNRRVDGSRPTVVLSPGPARVTNEPDPDFVARPVGFLATFEEPEPQLWHGDQA